MDREHIELTILMPCLNEAETVATCVDKAIRFLALHGVCGEVIVADNGSVDGSQALATQAGARVVPIAERGYGAALQGGIAAARGEFVIMGDADDSYDFSSLQEMLEKLRLGNDLVMGNRFAGGIEPGAMPFLHRYLGNPVLSFIGRLFYRNSIADFHCGLRGFRTSSLRALGLTSTGMEFASEMVVKAALRKLRIAEVPIRLHRDGRSRPPHLRTWRDGWRHLRFLLLYSPRWLFLIPGLLLLALGSLASILLGLQSLIIDGIGLDIHTLSYSGAAVILGMQMVIFSILTKSIGIRNGWLPNRGLGVRLLAGLTLERCLLVGSGIFLAGIAMSLQAVALWAAVDFGALDPSTTMRWVIPSVTLMAVGGEIGLSAFFLEALRQPEARQA